MANKKLKLRRWVKVVLLILVIGGLLILNNNETKKSVDKCVKAGHSYNFCIEGLR